MTSSPIVKPDYPFIRAWGILQRQPPFQIELAIQLAQDTHAPHDAIFSIPDVPKDALKRKEKRKERHEPALHWRTVMDLGSKVRSVLDQIVREAQEPTDA